MLWYYSEFLEKYNGKLSLVPNKHADFETHKYRIQEDYIADFLQKNCVKLEDPDEEINLHNLINIYMKWYNEKTGEPIKQRGLIEDFQNSEIGKFVKITARGEILKGIRFLQKNETLKDGEEYYFTKVKSMMFPEDNFGVPIETPEESYKKLCNDFDRKKGLFSSEGIYQNVDDNEIDFNELMCELPEPNFKNNISNNINNDDISSMLNIAYKDDNYNVTDMISVAGSDSDDDDDDDFSGVSWP